MKKIFKLFKWLIISIYVVSGILLVVFLWPHSGWRVYRVATGSMTPAIPQGSLVVDHSLPPRNYQIGQVVTYKNPAKPSETITHRIVSRGILSGSNIPTFVTKGDANNIADKPIVGGNIVGRVVWHIPYAGRALGWLKIPTVFIVLIIIPALLIIFDEIRVLIRTLDATHDESKSKSKDDEPPKPPSSGSGGQRPPARQPAAQQPARKSRSVDTIARHSAVLLLVTSFGVGVTYAQLTTHATLTNNSITTAPNSTNGQCPPGTTSVTIRNTSPGSYNKISIITTCQINITNNNNININNTNNQSSSSGNASSSGNTGGGTASSGSASDSNSTTTTVTSP